MVKEKWEPNSKPCTKWLNSSVSSVSPLWRSLLFGGFPFIFWDSCSFSISEPNQSTEGVLRSRKQGPGTLTFRITDRGRFDNSKGESGWGCKSLGTIRRSQVERGRTYTCIRSLSVWECSCYKEATAGWGMPVVWGPGGPGIIWENLKEGKPRKQNVLLWQELDGILETTH